MTLAQTRTPAPATARSNHRGWFWGTAALIALAQAVKYPTFHSYVVANLGQGPDVDGLPAEMVDGAVTVGSGAGLTLSLMLSLVALAALRWAGLKALPPTPRPGRTVFPFWLAGLGTVGLVVPDLISAATGTVQPWTTAAFLIGYPATVVLAVLLSPAPAHARFRLVDVAVAAFLPFV